MNPNRQELRNAPFPPRLVGALLLGLLPVIVLAVVLKGRRYDPDLYGFGGAEPVPALEISGTPPLEKHSISDSGKTPHVIPESLLVPLAANAFYQPSGPPARYGPKSIYEKINGAAPEYLELGFRELLTQSYKPEGEDFYGCELYVYHMTSDQNAEKIYAQQKAADAEAVGVGDGGRRFAATWFFHKGPYYVIVLNADEGEKAENFSELLARGVAERIAP